jgi:cytochrome c
MRSLLAAIGSVMALGVAASGGASAQDAAAGEKIFLQCRTCHQIGETAKNAVGPQLNGLFQDRKAGTAAGYSYSPAYKNLGEKVWSVENFTTYIKDPRGVTPGTKMVYAGLKDETQIKNLIAFLQQYDKDGKKK